MASRSSQPGKRPRRPGERTEKERRAPQGSGSFVAGGGKAAGRSVSGPRTGQHSCAFALPAGSEPALAPAGATLIYGRNPIREALRGRRRVHTIWLGPGTSREGLESLDVRHASPVELTSLAGSPDHQGMVASVDPYSYVEPDPLLRTFTLLVALDEVQDPHNLGAIIRTAEGAGAGIVIPRHRAAEVTAAVVKASAGATEHASIAQVRNLADFLAAAKEVGFWVYGAAAGAGSEYTGQDYGYPTCFVVGSEGQGLGKRVESLCDVMVSLPLLGKMDSLNVSVSTGILLYEAVRQRAAAGKALAPEVPDGAAP